MNEDQLAELTELVDAVADADHEMCAAMEWGSGSVINARADLILAKQAVVDFVNKLLT